MPFSPDTRDCVEKLLVEQPRALTLGAVRRELEKEDRELEEKMGYLQFLTPENLDVAAICREHMEVMEEVMRQLQEMTEVVAPAEKVGVRRGFEGSWSASSPRVGLWERCCRREARTMRERTISCLRSSTWC